MLFFIETSSTTDFFENSAQLLNLITVKIHILSQHTSDSEFTEKAAVVRSCLTMIITLLIKKKKAHNSNMSIITCLNLSIKLLSFFSSNSIMTCKTDFLFLIKRHLFSAISSFQNQKSKIHMLKNQIQIFLQIIFSMNTRWINNNQKIVIIIMLENQ